MVKLSFFVDFDFELISFSRFPKFNKVTGCLHVRVCIIKYRQSGPIVR